jgi:hypothetical protein
MASSSISPRRHPLTSLRYSAARRGGKAEVKTENRVGNKLPTALMQIGKTISLRCIGVQYSQGEAMSAYEETEDGLIRASLAGRIGKLLTQYKPDASESYDATLTLVLLQALLTICHELLNKPPSELKKIKSEKLIDVPPMHGLGKLMVSQFFPGQPEPTFYDVVVHLRHAVSHPLFPKHESKIFETGFMALNGHDGKIASYKFVHSPDVKKGKNKNVVWRDEAGYEDRIKVLRGLVRGLPSDVKSRIEEKSFDDRIEFQLNGQLLQRVFVMKIPVLNLKIFVGELSKLLSRPLENRPELMKQAQI